MNFSSVILIFVTLTLVSCTFSHDKVWISPDKTAELKFIKGPQGPLHSNEDSFSFYSLVDRESRKRLITVRSIINENTSEFVQKQNIYFSPTGRTILIEEDISDASPDYVYTLIHQEDGFYRSRDLALPVRRNSSGYDIFGVWPDVVSITDDAVEYRYFKDEPTITSRISELRDRGY